MMLTLVFVAGTSCQVLRVLSMHTVAWEANMSNGLTIIMKMVTIYSIDIIVLDISKKKKKKKKTEQIFQIHKKSWHNSLVKKTFIIALDMSLMLTCAINVFVVQVWVFCKMDGPRLQLYDACSVTNTNRAPG